MLLLPMGCLEAFVSTTWQRSVLAVVGPYPNLCGRILKTSMLSMPGSALIALALLIQLVRKHSYGSKMEICCWLSNWHDAHLTTFCLHLSLAVFLYPITGILIYHGIHRKIVRLLHPLLFTCIVFLCGFLLYAFQRAPVPDYLNADHLSDLKESIELHSISFPKDCLRVNHHNGLGVEVLENPWQQGARSAFFGFTPIVLAFSVFLAIRGGRYSVLRPYLRIGRIYSNQFWPSNAMV